MVLEVIEDFLGVPKEAPKVLEKGLEIPVEIMVLKRL